MIKSASMFAFLMLLVLTFRTRAGNTTSPAAPDFLAVGKKYNLLLYYAETPFEVLDIGSEGWIRVKLLDDDTITWLNTGAALLIQELE